MPAVRITTVEMHTNGEPVRIVTGGYPELQGATLLDKRRDARERLDRWRTMLMAEPRGHADMYGALLVPPDDPDADLAVLFLHNEGYSTMCGHATIALGRYAVDRGIVARTGPRTEVRLQCPCGLVRTQVDEAGGVSFASVPAFALTREALVVTPSYGPVTLDIGYGGAFYAVLPAAGLGLDLEASPIQRVVEAAMEIKTATAGQLRIEHPLEPDLGYLYGTILTDGGDGRDAPSRNICVFADGQVDRSPTGSGVTARMALMHRRPQVGPGEERSFMSLTGGVFTGRIVAETGCGRYPAVTVEVAGRAHYTGEAVFTLEGDDPLAYGFLPRR